MNLSLLTLFQAGLAHAQPTFNDVVVATVPTTSGTPLVLKMDIYKPANATSDTPVVTWIHGGGWTQGSYNAPIQDNVAELLNSGIAVATIGYRLSQEAPFPGHIQDVKTAIRFLRANASTYGLDGNRIASWGGSAGGHLSALLATSGGVSALEGTSGNAVGTSSRVLAAVDYFGPTDILNMNLDVTNPPGSTINHDAPNSPESMLIGFGQAGQGIGVLRANQNNPAAPYPQMMQRATLANPITHVDARDPVMFIAHGKADSLVPLKQSTRLHDALDSVVVPNNYFEVIGAGHGALGNATDALARAFLIAELTRPFGDATRDGQVDYADLLVVAQNFGSANASWRFGDFDTDGSVGSNDLQLMSTNYSSANGFAADWQLAFSTVPETGSGSLVLFAALSFFYQRRKR